jgi:hypothetical protein
MPWEPHGYWLAEHVFLVPFHINKQYLNYFEILASRLQALAQRH